MIDFSHLLLAQTATTFTEAIPVVLSLVLIEGLLSIDNALAIAAMSKNLDERRRKVAMTVGYAGAYGFRLIALFIADFIMNSHWLMLIGAAYLIWLMCDHFAEAADADDAAASGGASHHAPRSFAVIVAQIAFMDLTLSFDNVVAAVAMARDNIWLVYVGVTLGIITLRLVAGWCIELLKKHPWLEHTAFLLVGFVGCLLLYELMAGVHLEKQWKFAGIITILLLHWLYEKWEPLNKVASPLAKIILIPARAISISIGAIFTAASWPLKQAWRLFGPKPGQ
ncbi:MAG: DUF475 domain-containing protein [Verrucomicrobiales bacterium]|nr:DUF475 domain-containing protein [Verrucomicrobiales bacterium]MCP5556786.1 DUF475 domain-containing protein [Verrucomicrobiaceae bacterium]